MQSLVSGKNIQKRVTFLGLFPLDVA